MDEINKMSYFDFKMYSKLIWNYVKERAEVLQNTQSN